MCIVFLPWEILFLTTCCLEKGLNRDGKGIRVPEFCWESLRISILSPPPSVALFI